MLVGEIGVGKTTAALAVAAGLHARQEARQGRPRPFLAVVMCPGHLVEKWRREVEQVWPGARAAVIASAGGMARFARSALASPGVPHLAVVSKEMAKLGPGWEPAYNGNGTGLTARPEPLSFRAEVSRRRPTWVPAGGGAGGRRPPRKKGCRTHYRQKITCRDLAKRAAFGNLLKDTANIQKGGGHDQNGPQ